MLGLSEAGLPVCWYLTLGFCYCISSDEVVHAVIHTHRCPHICLNMHVYSWTHTPPHTLNNIYLYLHTHANSKRLLFPFITRCADLQHIHRLMSPFLMIYFSVLFWFCFLCHLVKEPELPHSQLQLVQVHLCLSSSQSLGKYPINNPVTTTSGTPTHHIHIQPMYMGVRAHNHTKCTRKTNERQRLLILYCCPVTKCYRWRFWTFSEIFYPLTWNIFIQNTHEYALNMWSYFSLAFYKITVVIIWLYR